MHIHITTVSTHCHCPLTVHIIHKMEYGFWPFRNYLTMRNFLVPKSIILCLSCLSSHSLRCKKILILSTGIARRCLIAKIAARLRYRLPIKNLTPHYNSQFCDSLVLIRKPADVYKKVYMGPKHNLVNVKHFWVVFL